MMASHTKQVLSACLTFLLLILTPYCCAQNSFSGTSVLSDQYGVCSHVSRTNVDWNYTDTEYALMKDVGIGWVRTDFDKGGRNDVFSSILQKAKKSNISVLPIFNQTLDDNTAFDGYVKSLVEKYSPYAHYWEAMNEADLLKGDKKENGKKYVAQLKKIYNTVKSADKRNQVLYSGVAGLSDFFETSMSEGAYRYFDVMNFHSYASPEGQIAQYNTIKSAMNRYGWQKPVWLTETGVTTIHYNNFFNEVLPAALRYLKIDPSKTSITVVYGDNLSPFADYAESYFKDFRAPSYVKTSGLKQLDVKKNPVLLISNEEYFPSKYSDDIVKYVKAGGVIICPFGVPFYYGEKVNGNLKCSDGSIYAKLHMGMLYYWTNEAKELKADVNPTSFYSAKHFTLDFPKTLKSEPTRYLLTNNLKQKDRFIPIVMASNGKYAGPICGIYDLNSDLKGKIIVCTRKETDYRSEDVQAYWLPRSALIGFANGIDKFFYYRLRASETNPKEREDYFGLVHSNFSKKPAYEAYKTLVTMCPNGSTRPTLTIKDGVYFAQWKRPDGKYVAAYWTVDRRDIVPVKNGSLLRSYDHMLEFYDYLGHKCYSSNDSIGVGPDIRYMVSSSKFEF